MSLNFEDLRRLSDLLKVDEDSSESEDDLPRVGVHKFGPGDIKKTVKITDTGSKVIIKSNRDENEEETKVDDKCIWEEYEIPDGIVYDESEDPRDKPEYEIKYMQNVTPEDMFLQMGLKTPATASCEAMTIEIKLPGEDNSSLDVQVLKQVLELRSKKYRLSLPLPHPVDPKTAKASWNPDKSILNVTTILNRELDFANF